jgi:hypothetical protein
MQLTPPQVTACWRAFGAYRTRNENLPPSQYGILWRIETALGKCHTQQTGATYGPRTAAVIRLIVKRELSHRKMGATGATNINSTLATIAQ